jgi:alcohol dehydrogenase class IV
MVDRAPGAIARLAAALGEADAPAAVESLLAKVGVRSLRELGVSDRDVDPILDALEGRREIANTPRPPDRDELRGLVVSALG